MARNHFRKIIKPGLQLKVIAVFTGTAVLCLVFQAVLMTKTLGVEGQTLSPHVVSSVLQNLLLSIGLLVPVSFVIGAMVTHRIAGPIYRFEQYLGQVAESEVDAPCRIRRNDELHDLCAAINRATWERSDSSAPRETERTAA